MKVMRDDQERKGNRVILPGELAQNPNAADQKDLFGLAAVERERDEYEQKILRLWKAVEEYVRLDCAQDLADERVIDVRDAKVKLGVMIDFFEERL